MQAMTHKQEQFNDQAVKDLVVKEFRDAMQTQIVPAIESTLKKVLTNIEKPMQEINIALCEKLSADEDRNEGMVSYYQNSLERLLWVHQRMGMMSQQQVKQQLQQQMQSQKEFSMQMIEPMRMEI